MFVLSFASPPGHKFAVVYLFYDGYHKILFGCSTKKLFTGLGVGFIADTLAKLLIFAGFFLVTLN